MATVKQCRAALESLARRLLEMEPEARRSLPADRTVSCHVHDLGITFLTRVGARVADPITEAAAGHRSAQIRITASSEEVLAVATNPSRFQDAWQAGRLKVEGSFVDLFLLRRFIALTVVRSQESAADNARRTG
jgi:hypothetical protein